MRALGPRAPMAAGQAVGMWWVLSLCWGLFTFTGLVWVAAQAAAALTGGRVPPFGERWVVDLVRGHTSQAWPGTPTLLVAVIGTVLAGSVAAVVVTVWRLISRRLPRPEDPVSALHRNPGIQPLAPGPSARTAVRLRSSLAGTSLRKITPADTGLILGDLKVPAGRGLALYASWEDTIVAFMAPRSGKTTAMGVPYVLSAPGPVVATSIKADLWAATAQLRADRGSTVWLFDPQRIAGQPQEC